MDVNFCVGCDNTAVDGFYCSERCRLSDLERSSSNPGSPMYSTGVSASSSYVDHHSHHGHHHNHQTHHSHHGQATFSSPPTRAQSWQELAARESGSNERTKDRSSASSPHRDLSPASSSRHFSLSSSHPDHGPEEMQRELRSYYNAFDRVRELRRRSVPGTTLPHPTERGRHDSH